MPAADDETDRLAEGKALLTEFFAAVDEQIAAGTVRMLFWTCPDKAHKMVTWRRDDHGLSIPTCDECGIEGPPR